MVWLSFIVVGKMKAIVPDPLAGFGKKMYGDLYPLAEFIPNVMKLLS